MILGRRRPRWLPVALDLLAAAVAAATSLLDALATPEAGLLAGRTSSVVVAGVASGVLLFRRRAPLAVALVVGLAHALDVALVPFVIGMYTVAAAHGNRRALWLATAVGAAADLSPWKGFELGWLTSIATTVVFPVVVGLYVNARRHLLAELLERAGRLERERNLVDARARAEERTRIAREMHDVVAHRVSLMVLQSGALELAVGQSPDRAAQAAQTIRTTGRQALEELRHIVGVLRGDEEAAPLAPQPTLADLDTLIEDWKQAGARIELRVAGEHRPLPPGVERTAYRLVQEALTNARKHAAGAGARVELEYRPRGLQVTVVNSQSGGSSSPDLPSGGHGLAGLRERVALAGGILEAGPTAEGGFRVAARLPA
jgi:signal transduction histidine kinase